jgi:hypothetical protein
MKVRILFYIPRFDGHLLDDAIANWTGIWNPQTWGKDLLTSHAEVWTPNSLNDFSDFRGQCWTSTMRKGKYNGVRKAPAAEVLEHPHRWYFYEIEMNQQAYDAMVFWMSAEVISNLGYDKLAIGSYFTPFRWGDPKRWICSEFTGEAINQAAEKTYPEAEWSGKYLDKYRRCPSPLRLSGWLNQMGLEKVELIDELKGE